MVFLPEFNEDGLLPPQDYPLTIDNLKTSPLVTGEHSQDKENWDSEWRAKLVQNAEVMIQQLWQVGIEAIYLDGSFVEDKSHPNDIDGYFECELQYLASGQLERDLNALDPNKVWTWAPSSRKAYRNYAKKQLPMWFAYRVELYPHCGLPSGILDEFGNNQLFPAAFRKARSFHKPKGIVKINRQEG